MKPESVKHVEQALMDADKEFRSSQHINSRGAHLAKAAIRAVMQTDEVRGLVEALRFYADNHIWWDITDGGKCHTATNADQGERARKALAELENKP